MQACASHRYIGEIRLDGGAVLTTAPLEIDWMPAIEWRHLQDVRRGAVAATSAPAPVRIEPRFDDRWGRPYVASIDVTAAHGAAAQSIPLQYFAEPVSRAVSGLVESGRVAVGANYTWRVCAFDADLAEVDERSPVAFAVDELSGAEPPRLTRSLTELLRRSQRHGPRHQGAEAIDIPVFVSRRVLDETIEAATAAGEFETGGVLLGTLARDTECGELVVEVRAQVPATEAVAEEAALRFTPRTWQAVHAALELRHAGEQIVGWWHSHPRSVWPCRKCPGERRAGCQLNRAFFSTMDVAVHRTAFQGALNQALLISFLEDPRPRHDLFGWRQGLVAAREYHILEPVTELTE